MLEAALAAGIAAGAARRCWAGCCRRRRPRSSRGASASTSRRWSPPRTTPFGDNGIKFFDPTGASSTTTSRPRSRPTGRARRASRARDRSRAACARGRLRRLHARAPVGLPARPLRASGVCLDCANGATYRGAPRDLRAPRRRGRAIGAEPDGRNINEGCGSTHPEAPGRAGRGSGRRSASPSTATATA